METLTAISNWISDSESVLSGAAAIIVLLGVLGSALGFVYRRMAEARAASSRPAPVPGDDASITLERLSAPAQHCACYTAPAAGIV